MRKTSSILVACVLVLLALGIVMLASASSGKGVASVHDPHFFLKKQVVWLALSILAGILIAAFDYHWWQKVALPLAVISGLLLVIVLIPGLGVEVGGSRRWIHLGPLSFQPSELAKFCSVVVLCAWIIRAGPRIGNFKEGILYPMCGLGAVVLMMILEPDFGTTLLTGMTGMLILFGGGARLGYLSGWGSAPGFPLSLRSWRTPSGRDVYLHS